MVQLSHSYMITGKTIALTRWTFVGKVMALLFNMLSRFVITFLPRGKHLLISWLQSPSAVILEPRKIKSVIVSLSICHEIMGLDAMIFNFKTAFSLSSLTFIKRLFSSSLLSDISVVSSAYLRLKRRLADFKCSTGVHLFLASNLIGCVSGSFQVGTQELIYVLWQWSSLNSQRTESPVLKTLWTLTCVYIYLTVHSYSLVSFVIKKCSSDLFSWVLQATLANWANQGRLWGDFYKSPQMYNQLVRLILKRCAAILPLPYHHTLTPLPIFILFTFGTR